MIDMKIKNSLLHLEIKFTMTCTRTVEIKSSKTPHVFPIHFLKYDLRLESSSTSSRIMSSECNEMHDANHVLSNNRELVHALSSIEYPNTS